MPRPAEVLWLCGKSQINDRQMFPTTTITHIQANGSAPGFKGSEPFLQESFLHVMPTHILHHFTYGNIIPWRRQNMCVIGHQNVSMDVTSKPISRF